MKKTFDVHVDDSNIEIFDWINSHFENGNYHRKFEATVTLREYDWTEDGEPYFLDEEDAK